MDKFLSLLGKLSRAVLIAAVVAVITLGIVQYFNDDTRPGVQKTIAAGVTASGLLGFAVALRFEFPSRHKGESNAIK
jgi:hypothetical protein